MNPLIKRRLLTLASLLGAYFITVTMAPKVFIANTPQINTQYIASLGAKPQELVALLKNSLNFTPRSELAQLNQNKVTNPPAGLQFVPMAKGVQAAEDPSTGKKYVHVQAGTNLSVYTFKLKNGKTLTIYVPAE